MYRKLLSELGQVKCVYSKDEILKIFHDEIRHLQMLEYHLGEQIKELQTTKNAEM